MSQLELFVIERDPCYCMWRRKDSVYDDKHRLVGFVLPGKVVGVWCLNMDEVAQLKELLFDSNDYVEGSFHYGMS